MRSHPNSLRTQEFINRLWRGYSPETALTFPLSYVDGLRFRRPGGFSQTVRPHIDAGSLDRWGSRYYEAIFSGDILSHDPYDLTWRLDAESAKYPGWQQSTIFRSFQGWTSLSTCGGGFGKGSLAVYPSLNLAIAYVILRPFFRPPASGSLDPYKWEWDDSPDFPGSFPGYSQQLAQESHPHLELGKTLSLTPTLNPGDAVFWHSDVRLNSTCLSSENETRKLMHHVPRSSTRLILFLKPLSPRRCSTSRLFHSPNPISDM